MPPDVGRPSVGWTYVISGRHWTYRTLRQTPLRKYSCESPTIEFGADENHRLLQRGSRLAPFNFAKSPRFSEWWGAWRRAIAREAQVCARSAGQRITHFHRPRQRNYGSQSPLANTSEDIRATDGQKRWKKWKAFVLWKRILRMHGNGGEGGAWARARAETVLTSIRHTLKRVQRR